MLRAPDRRALLIGALALAACEGRAQPARSRPGGAGPLPALKDAAPFPVGVAVNTERLADPQELALVARHFDQVTAEWQMKMEVILRADGGFDFAAADQIAGFARAGGLRLFGHTLIWYEQKPEAFARLLGDRAAFERAYRNYILAVAGRYRGQAVAWDVVNEAVTDQADGLRGGLWMDALGPRYIDTAFHLAREADPGAALFLNDYGLERADKRRVFLRLAEDLLKRGAPLSGLGTQAHLHTGLSDGAIRTSIRDLASLGLPVHVSELDVRTKGAADPLQDQARVVGAIAGSFAALPERQRFAFTVWGLRDSDSWLVRREGEQGPLLFDDAGAPKPAFRAAIQAWS
jgi:endo-1,4-beta-xylanase